MAKQPKQYLFVSQRDITITSTLGYSIEFKKGEPTHVPRAMHAEVLDKGIVAADPVDAEQVTEAAAPRKILVAPEDGDERKAQVDDAIRAIVKRNSSKDFSASGIPSAAAVTGMVGWKAEPSEIRESWARLRVEVTKGEGK